MMWSLYVDSGLCEYENQRLKNIDANNRVLIDLGLKKVHIHCNRVFHATLASTIIKLALQKNRNKKLMILPVSQLWHVESSPTLSHHRTYN